MRRGAHCAPAVPRLPSPVGSDAHIAPAFGTNAICRRQIQPGSDDDAGLIQRTGSDRLPGDCLLRKPWRTMCAATRAGRVSYCLIPNPYSLYRMNSKNPVLAYDPARDDCTQVQEFCSLLHWEIVTREQSPVTRGRGMRSAGYQPASPPHAQVYSAGLSGADGDI